MRDITIALFSVLVIFLAGDHYGRHQQIQEDREAAVAKFRADTLCTDACGANLADKAGK